ncbi:hypothetical protein P3T36_000207 [Kitasatospora sp. MAP12-15]|uniref:hypothetical protein n=1 Tax=unclassified Kitasatospora TaxID=2633591 RepID=UPI002473CDE7|nr:hypothetical protein [Kitasatospora sp. MAP12-44]MDH6109436.1 hypothetical protein [Kitasatospora sp. MAP12-44]
MALDEPTAQGVRFLLALVDDELAGHSVCERLRINPAGMGGLVPSDPRVRRLLVRAPGSMLLWMLQGDDPEVNARLYGVNRLPLGLRRDILTGVSFADPAPAARVTVGRLADASNALNASNEEYQQALTDLAPDGIIAQLYEAGGRAGGSFRRARTAAGRIRSEQWPAVLRAHQDSPFPGYARWALSQRIDCPAELRARFGESPRYRHRLREAGIFDGPAEYVQAAAPAAEVLRLLGIGRWAYPGRLAQAGAVLRPLVHADLGTHLEAWAVLAQLLPDFVGTLPELIRTAGAIAGPAPQSTAR